MFSKQVLRYLAKKSYLPYLLVSERRCYSKRASKPLRILFCGSDEFSCESLKALHKEQQRDKDGILSIDVLCRPGKRSGRSMKSIREVPLKIVGQKLGLSVHERDTFTGWDLPIVGGESINLIVAVSFGLFVPSRILKTVEYGGINLHPSLLPNFYGPAPLQHTILSGERFTGVTLQTLHHKSFDQGNILDQTPQFGCEIKQHKHVKYEDLLQMITPIAATMLVKGIRDRVFVPPLAKISLPDPPAKLVHARKIQTDDKEVDWQTWSAITVDRRYRALGALWNTIYTDHETNIRIRFEDFELVDRPPVFDQWYTYNIKKTKKHSPEAVASNDLDGDGGGNDLSSVNFLACQSRTGETHPLPFVVDGESVIVPAHGGALRISHITAAGMKKKTARRVAETLCEARAWQIISRADQPSPDAINTEPEWSDMQITDTQRQLGFALTLEEMRFPRSREDIGIRVSDSPRHGLPTGGESSRG